MDTISPVPMAWSQAAVTLIVAAYLFMVLLRQGLRVQGDLRAVFMVAAWVLLPSLLLAVWIYGGANLSAVLDRQLEMNRDTANWWVLQIQAEADGDARYLNLIAAGIVFSVLYIAVALIISAVSSYRARKKGVEFLSLHKALFKWGIVLAGCVLFLQIRPWPLLLGMGAASIVLGFALKEMLENLFTGMTLDMEGAFHRGDWIRVGDSGVVGRVYEKNWRATRIITTKHESITIPNRILGSEKILCYNRPNEWFALNLRVGASYNDPPVKVKEILRGILMRHPDIVKNPAPNVRTVAYDDSCVTYDMKFWITDYAKRMRIVDAVMTQVWYAFKFYGVEIPFPVRTVHFKDREELREEQTVIAHEVDSNREFLQDLPFLKKHLTFKDIDFLAQNTFKRGYFPDEPIVQRGDYGESLHIVVNGTAVVIMADGRRVELAAGQYFGEMGLLGGRVRTADVVAGPDGALVLRLDKYCMDVLFRNHPDLLQEFRALRDIRKEELPVEKAGPTAPKKSPLRRAGRLLAGFLRPW